MKVSPAFKDCVIIFSIIALPVILTFLCLSISGCGVQLGDTGSDNTLVNTVDDHSVGVTTCTASVVPAYPENQEDNTKCNVVYTSFNGGVCSTQVFDSIDQCNESAEQTPEIMVEEPTTPPATIGGAF